MNWINEHWLQLIGIVGAIVTIAGRIVDLTPTDKDNKVLDTVIGVLKVVGLKVGPMDPKENK